MVLLHKVAHTVPVSDVHTFAKSGIDLRCVGKERRQLPARENGAETAGSAELARGLTGTQSKRQLQKGVLQKWYPFSCFKCRHHETKQVTVKAFTPASSFGGVDVSADGLAQHLANDASLGRRCSLITSGIDVPDDRVNLILINGVFVWDWGGTGRNQGLQSGWSRCVHARRNGL